MPDVVVTVPKGRWAEWIREGDLPGEEWSGLESYFTAGGGRPAIRPGERVYVVAHGRLRGYAPLYRIEETDRGVALVRRSRAVAVTIRESIKGFRGWRYRWWERWEEIPFPEWRDPDPVNEGLFAQEREPCR